MMNIEERWKLEEHLKKNEDNLGNILIWLGDVTGHPIEDYFKEIEMRELESRKQRALDELKNIEYVISQTSPSVAT